MNSKVICDEKKKSLMNRLGVAVALIGGGLMIQSNPANALPLFSHTFDANTNQYEIFVDGTNEPSDMTNLLIPNIFGSIIGNDYTRIQFRSA